MRIKFLIAFLLFSTIDVSSQNDSLITRYGASSTDFVLEIHPRGEFNYSRTEVISDDIIETDIELAGFWDLKNNKLILKDTLFPIENVNRKSYQLEFFKYYTLLNYDLPFVKEGDTVFLIGLSDPINNWHFHGRIKNGEKNGEIIDIKNNLRKTLKNDVVIETKKLIKK